VDDIVPGGLLTEPTEALNLLELGVDKLAPDAFLAGWEERAVERVRAHPVYTYFFSSSRLMCAALCTGSLDSSPEVTQFWPTWERDMLSLLLLRLRTERYESITAPATAEKEASVTFERRPVPCLQHLVYTSLYNAHLSTLMGFKAARNYKCSEAALAATVAACQAAIENGTTVEVLMNTLRDLYVSLDSPAHTQRPADVGIGPCASLLGYHLRLSRIDTIKILAGFNVKPVPSKVMRALAFGLWSTDQVQCLRRQRAELFEYVGDDDELKNELELQLNATQLCTRKGSFNNPFS
jgi:hypothetical protein